MKNTIFEHDVKIVSQLQHEPIKILDEHQWNNYDNKEFYAKIRPEQLEIFAKKGGLSNCCDIKLLEKYWENSSSILEIGAGYGRVINFLLSQHYQGKITAIERSQLLFAYLDQLYGDEIQLLNIDIHNCNQINTTFDMILFAWSGIQDFSPKEQQLLISDLLKLLNKNGKLVIDTIPSSIAPLKSERSDMEGVHKLKLNNAVIYIYSITSNQINIYGQDAGFKNIEHVSYTTDTGRNRIFHIMSL